ncbi:hypothetical protein [Alloalcanivorax xenomutans]|uniref:Uncharacterized protein n=1 Tax=Alloalcanivorax xenomutans TaxID=1094342 RepID=A0A9Q3W936_9GAMM|nr:hypothetical protein [Alloalcanivorax xenomutans]MCE7511345.1 hypothetical protein [Alloalcanivorax xenomutans]
MKTIGGVLLTSVAFFAIWLLAAVLTIVIAFRGWGDSGIAEYLRLGMAWFVCPGIGGYYAPRVTSSFISGVNMDSVIASFLTIISMVFVVFMGVSIVAYGSEFGGGVSEMFQLSLQFASMIIGTLMGKAALNLDG